MTEICIVEQQGVGVNPFLTAEKWHSHLSSHCAILALYLMVMLYSTYRPYLNMFLVFLFWLPWLPETNS